MIATATLYLCLLIAGQAPACHRQAGPHVTLAREACERALAPLAARLRPGGRELHDCRIQVERR